ncbi:rhodanese-like domain-containing protein [Mesohalobacter halotolerans]|uniref:Rhodanese-like domain-containing protein n=1 Tax=Mesohalobacter halotolerans TaxID=1883405 RepID=A0A4U5TQ78_9FLAO|nr:rhodanese-like domain-containing protein [Mesohalobacter halotolerans]MBS3737924.1 rhodanese-like domain-containing protein [Psychroflexus sp.]TKS56176.1 rhodanese-like domain-containing protein [Mesohalobacter halotolerans]
MKNLDNKSWEKALKNDQNSVILDVRTPEEYEEQRIPNSKLIDVKDAQQFVEEVEKLDKTKAYYLYCKAGGRSAMACNIMEQMGFSDVSNLEGGITEWHGEVEE